MQTDARSLREQAEQLQNAAKKLIEAADVLEGFGQNNGHRPIPERKRRVIQLKADAPRLDELKKFLKERGPLTRNEIVASAGMPKGTIAHLLKTDNGFKREENKKWSYVEK